MPIADQYLITSALPYANGALHLGHLSGAYLPADLLVRYLRLQGKKVVFVCGSDEHGAAITMRAKKEGVTPREIIDKYHHLNEDTFRRLGISFDIYHRTSDPLHFETAQQFFTQLYEKGGEFEERITEQYFDEAYQQFLADRYIVGTCPRCNHPEAYGDQCENCGSALSPTELINPRSTLSGQAPVLKPTKHWYFKLDKHQDWLREWIENGVLDGQIHHDPNTWKKHVVGQCLSWLDGGLQPRAITRDLDWGIPVPLPDAVGKVLYVWFDAPIGYISATRQWALNQGENWEDYWKNPDCKLVHFIGKDNIVFHCIVFPAMLRAHGGYELPVNVPANQFLNFEGRKFSKSRGWGIEQHEYLDTFRDFPNKEDALRYALIRNMPENRDSDFTWDDFVDFHDKELADNLGNFVNRVAVLLDKYYGGAVPEPSEIAPPALETVHRLTREWCDEMEAYSFKGAAQKFLEVSSFGNTFLQDAAPWAIWKEDPDSQAVKDCLYACAQIVALLSTLAHPFIPFAADRMRQLIGLAPVAAGDLAADLENLDRGQPLLAAGHQVGTPEILFAKINDRKDTSRMDLIRQQKEKLQHIMEAEAPANPFEPVRENIAYDDFAKLDLRIGTVVAAEKVVKADKLLKLTIDLGFEQRTVVSGIAKFFEPETVVGRQVVLVANLAPRELRGILSQGMILMAENEKGELGFVSPPENWTPGSTVK